LLEASSIVEIDFTAAEILKAVIGQVRAAGLDFAVARLESVRAQAAFQRFGVTDLLGADHLFHSVAEAIAQLGGEARLAPGARPGDSPARDGGPGVVRSDSIAR
jgi:MFS superfamily sulfate permease-like transporter